tara:strand:+ start:581 stop:1354 length:774 start_codon:yes stop_codon:yes gene_type:complete
LSFALKRKLPQIYKILKKFEKYVPAEVYLWDKKKYSANLKIVSLLSIWQSWPRLKTESKVVYDFYTGGDFLDIGAFQGVYAFILAPKAKKNDTFILCEPDMSVKKELLDNIRILKNLFKYVNFKHIFEPIGNGNKVVRNPTIYGHPKFESKDTFNNKNNSTESFNSITLDELVKINKISPTFIKIDVEGAEYNVLNGMKNIFETLKPIIMLEKHPTLLPKNVNIGSINSLLHQNGYEMVKEIYKDDVAITEIWKNSN